MKKSKFLLTLLIAGMMATSVAGLAACGGAKPDNSGGTNTEKPDEGDNGGGGNGGGDNGGGGQSDTQAPTITVTGVPVACNVGDTVVLPTATAVDNVDGDVTSKVKVTVSQMKEDGVSVNRDMIYEKPANVAQEFTANSNTLLKYTITYSCKDTAGNKATESFILMATGDDETGTLTVNGDTNGISATAGADITLPSATAIDQPGDTNISNRVKVRIYEKINGTKSETIFTSFEDFAEAKTVRLPAGTYEATYSVTDTAGNLFDTTVSFPITVAQPAETNLAKDMQNFVLDEKEGMSWVNEFGEVAIGHTSVRPDLDQTVGFVENVTKIHEQYVGITFNADPPDGKGQNFYTIAARGSKDRGTMPTKETCTWPNYLFLRINRGGIESRIEKNSDKEMTTLKKYSGNLLDGQDHTIYVQWRNVGSSASAADAAIMLYGWVDTTPAVGTENASFIYKAVAGGSIADGVLTNELFTELWNETGAGWFTMDTYGSERPYSDDHMRLKGLVIYDKDETTFGADIMPPVVTANFDNSSVFALNEGIAIPSASSASGESVSAYIIKPDGSKATVSGSYTPTTEGTYQLVYSATDNAGNVGYKNFKFEVKQKDTQAPTLDVTVSNSTVNIGEGVSLPTATANDNVDGNITSNIRVIVDGTEYAELLPGDMYYPMTAGVQKVTYVISDAFGNSTTESFEVTVNAGSNRSDMLSGENAINLYGANMNRSLTGKEHIYDQKVSMVLNMEKNDGVVMFNVRGTVSNGDWPKGMVIRFRGGSNTVEISAKEHDQQIFGVASWDMMQYAISQKADFLFEYQIENVTVGGVEYVRARMWIQGEELTFKVPSNGQGGEIGVESGSKAIYKKVSTFTGDLKQNLYSSPFHIASYNSIVSVKSLRIDGTSCTKPTGPVKPDSYTKPTFDTSGNAFVEANTAIAEDGNDVYQAIGKNSNEDYISVSFKGSDVAKGTMIINILGEASGWNCGLALRLSQDALELRANNVNDGSALAYLTGCPYNSTDGINTDEYTLVYKLTYIMDGSSVSGIQLDVWIGIKGGTLTKCEFVSCTNSTYENGKYIIDASVFATTAEATPGLITVVLLNALNSGCDWTITEIKKLDGAPNA